MSKWRTEIEEIWDSLEPEIRSDLERLDHRIKYMWQEARVFCYDNKIIREVFQRKFLDLVKEVAEQ